MAGTEASARLAAMLDAVREGVVAIDADGTLRSVNEAASRLLRMPASALIGRRAAALPGLAPLFEVLARSTRIEGVLVHLGHASLLVTVRPSAGDLVVMLEEPAPERAVPPPSSSTRRRWRFADLIGSSAALGRTLDLARRAAKVSANLLVTGESGTGKEIVTQAIHTGGARACEPFVAVNCAAIPRELLEAELFGYERGAFTGARTEGAIGKIQQAGDGTLLLDEIGDMPLEMQAKLLRVLQERIYSRLGSGVEHALRARVIATTHRNLDMAVRQGSFRLDLLHRLRVLHLTMPALRERREDIAAIAQHFVHQFGAHQGKAVRTIGEQCLAHLVDHDWPGNVRELANVIEREVSLLAPEATSLEALTVPFRLPSTPPSDSAIMPMAEVEKRAHLEALRACGGNITKAAKALGVSRAQFYVKLRQWNVSSDEGD